MGAVGGRWGKRWRVTYRLALLFEQGMAVERSSRLLTVRAGNRVVGCGVVLLAVAGCTSSGGDSLPPPTDGSMLRGIVRCYAVATGELGRPPENMKELQAPLAPVTNDPAQYFRSTRDGEEFVVVWGLHLSSLPPDTIIAYERTGVGGKRMVVDLNGNTPEVTEEEFAKLKFPKDHAPER